MPPDGPSAPGAVISVGGPGPDYHPVRGGALGTLHVVAGPDAGIAEASVDGAPSKSINLYHTFSKGLHYPRTVMLGAGLKPGKHTLTLRISADTKSSGHAMRIMQFTAN